MQACPGESKHRRSRLLSERVWRHWSVLVEAPARLRHPAGFPDAGRITAFQTPAAPLVVDPQRIGGCRWFSWQEATVGRM